MSESFQKKLRENISENRLSPSMLWLEGGGRIVRRYIHILFPRALVHCLHGVSIPNLWALEYLNPLRNIFWFKNNNNKQTNNNHWSSVSERHSQGNWAVLGPLVSFFFFFFFLLFLISSKMHWAHGTFSIVLTKLWIQARSLSAWCTSSTLLYFGYFRSLQD